MNGIELIFDSNVIIYLSKEVISIDEIIHNDENVGISVITYMEVLGYNFKNRDQENFVKNLLDCFEIIYIDQEIVDNVILLRKKYKIKLPDVIICSTAITHDAILVTNDSDLKTINELNMRYLNL